MDKTFNDRANPRPHHYILKLSLHAGVDHAENPQDKDKPAFQQAVLFLKRVKSWLAKKGRDKDFKGEILPVSDDARPRVRLSCPPAVLDDICRNFAGKINQVNEIPLPKPPAKPLWRRIFGG